MSEPLTSQEIETVLSSIRRLVSSDLRPTLRPPENGAAVDALLLTPALRVVSDFAEMELPPPPANNVPRAPVLYLTNPAPAPAKPQPDLSHEATAPMAVVDDEEMQIFFGEAAPLGRQSTRSFADYAEDYDAEPAIARSDSGLRVVLERSALTGGDAGNVTSFPSAMVQQGAQPLAPVPEVDWTAGEADWTAEAAAQPVPVAEEPLAQAWAERAEAEIRAELSRAADARAAALPEPRDEAEDDWVDEELLRDLVRAIIREELAGSLGERMTRNVRKLVRLEVNRALTSRDFE